MTAPGLEYRVPMTDPTDLGNRPGDGPFRPGGQPAALPSTEENLPSTQSAAAKRQSRVVIMLRDLWLGTEQVRDRSTVYLPQAPGEDSQNYNVRLKRSVFFNVFRHTLEVLVGFVFRRDPDLGKDVPPQIVEDCENIDLAGTHLDVFARYLMQDALLAGHAAILVDYPAVGDARLTRADEQGLRPYWVPIKKDNILSWRTVVELGRTILSQVVLKELLVLPKGDYGEQEQVCYRVLTRTPASGEAKATVSWQLLIVSPAKTVSEIGKGVYGNQIEIPLVEVRSSGHLSLFESEPPLLDLAYLNVAHYQQWSDYATSLHKTCIPLLFTAGFDMVDESGNAIVVGPNTGVNSINPAGKMEYVSHSGQALSACKDSLDDLKNEMAVLGVAMLSTRKRAPETAEAKRIDRGSFDSSLAVTARALQDAIEQALDIHARYYQMDDGGSIAINRDFENMTMPSDLLTAYVDGVAKAGLPVRILLTAMQEGGLISADVDLDVLEMEMNANAAAAAEQERQAAVDARNAALGGGKPKPVPAAA